MVLFCLPFGLRHKNVFLFQNNLLMIATLTELFLLLVSKKKCALPANLRNMVHLLKGPFKSPLTEHLFGPLASEKGVMSANSQNKAFLL